MRYWIQDQNEPWGDALAIVDDDGRIRFRVQGSGVAEHESLQLLDSNAQELALISQPKMALQPRYQIHVNGLADAELIQKSRVFNSYYVLQVEHGITLQLEGAFYKHDYVFRDASGTHARVSQAIRLNPECYAVEIEKTDLDLYILCACLVVDWVLHRDNEQADDYE